MPSSRAIVGAVSSRLTGLHGRWITTGLQQPLTFHNPLVRVQLKQPNCCTTYRCYTNQLGITYYKVLCPHLRARIEEEAELPG